MLISFRLSFFHNFSIATVFLMALSSFSFADKQKDVKKPETVIATLNGESITNADLSIAEGLTPEFGRFPPEQRTAIILSNLIEIRLLAREAEKKGLDQDPDFKSKMDFLKKRALQATLVNYEITEKITESELRDFYNKEVAVAVPPDEIHARHILVKTKKDANTIIKDLDSGKKFEDLAKEKSIDPVSSQKGGDLGYFTRGYLVPEFEKAAFEVPVGKYTKKPVQTKFGFHIIRVEDKRKQPLLTFDEAKQQALSVLVKKKYIAKIQEMRSAAKLEILDDTVKKNMQAMEEAAQASQAPDKASKK